MTIRRARSISYAEWLGPLLLDRRERIAQARALLGDERVVEAERLLRKKTCTRSMPS